MPSRRKSLMFASAAFASLCSIIIVCFVLATKNWVSSTIDYSDGNSTVRISIHYGLFEGSCSRNVHNGIGTPDTSFQVAGSLGNSQVKIFNDAITFLLVLSLLCSFLSFGFTSYNVISNPYQTFLGPIGVYTWNSISGISCLLALILFPVNVELNKLSIELASGSCSSTREADLSNVYEYSYWIMLLIIIFNAAAVIITVFYQHARYSKKKERDRPMESAPKDGILF